MGFFNLLESKILFLLSLNWRRNLLLTIIIPATAFLGYKKDFFFKFVLELSNNNLLYTLLLKKEFSIALVLNKFLQLAPTF